MNSATGRTALPRKPEEITAEWMSGALAQKHPGTVVKSVVQGTTIRGSATEIRVMLDYNEAGHEHGLPTTMWARTLMESHGLSHPLTWTRCCSTAISRHVTA